MKLYPERLNRDFENSESTEKVLTAYDKIMQEDLKKRAEEERKKIDEAIVPAGKIRHDLTLTVNVSVVAKNDKEDAMKKVKKAFSGVKGVEIKSIN